MRGIWIVKSAVTSAPIFVPRAPPVRHRIVSARLLADPKDQLSQYFSSTDSALLWLRHCAQCLNSLQCSLPAHQSTGSILLSSYAALFIKEAGVYRVKRYPEANRNQDPASRQEPAISNELPPNLIDSISARVKFLGIY